MTTTYVKKFDGNTAALGRTLVLFGGTSSEREVSLRSGAAVLQALQAGGVDAHGLDVQADAIAKIEAFAPDRVFIALHGPGGEDGKMQAVLDWLAIPYTGSDHAASALAMDKLKTKQVWQSVGLVTPEYASLVENSDWQAVLDSLGGQGFVKPAHEGSSIGMSVVSTAQELKAAYEKAAHYDAKVLVERRIVGREFTVAVLNGVALPAIGLKTDHVFYDYDAKYVSNTTQYLCPCGLTQEKEAELQSIAQQAFAAVGCKGWGRVDFMQDEAGNFYLLEVNTVPGMTDHSLVPMAARQSGIEFNELVLEILAQTLV
ncbi:D-alanine--D-alanine ligase [Saccharophagus degradans]|uniref:D-alanine--D-alanine ligase n=1 Tax=Saccharophagus degradans (strain 2-40 / ATCC 43961 / DSM 17024) TaxID=203122 RepID=DDL_SACD2|nr:D-alanine--D-alanine ligase [Saccharophagus degradans]Q21MG7.1 RecName: Full=D-alanine--D-alanine ligase; AltName: Full=D-Ala-D-Ala ligase; AltName: Full=D-alanylalanine synthetase [Saccharophagus degradans 2-40]ABD80112.1 D-alanine--D-alanine ligase [Saccharophagus degradans 2-40]